MKARLRAASSFFIAASFALLLGSCGGGGGSNAVLFHFGMNGSGDCDSVVVEVDLAAAGAVLERNGDAIACAVNQLLEGDCDVDFDDSESGRLRVTVDDCTLDAETSLFYCEFTNADLSALASASEASCDCSGPACDATPPLCIGHKVDPGSCEDCNNGVDDDGNGETDCSDANCEHRAPCVSVTTTSSSTSSTGSLPSTTLIEADRFQMTFSLTNAANVGTISWDIFYGGALARTRAADIGSPHCANLVPGATGSFVDEPEEEVLHATVSGLPGSSGPLEVAVCDFEASTMPDSDDFEVNVISALDLEGEALQSVPELELGDIVPVVTTTTLSSATTTLTGQTTTTVFAGEAFYVTFRLHAASGPVGALQYDIDYSALAGSFEGSNAAVNCVSHIDQDLFAPNDLDDQKVLTLGQITFEPFEAPADLATCFFVGGPVDPDDFVITVVDATDGRGMPVTALIKVRVQTDEPPPTTTTTTMLTGDEYDVTVRLVSAPEPLGSLQVLLDYTAAPGGFVGSGGTVDCDLDPSLNALYAANDVDSQRKLRMGFVTFATFSAPRDVAVCRFRGTEPEAADFIYTVEESSNGELVSVTGVELEIRVESAQ